MVLLIPQAVRELKEAGRVEGRKEAWQRGFEEGRAMERARFLEILDRMDNMLPPEVIEEIKVKLFGADYWKQDRFHGPTTDNT